MRQNHRLFLDFDGTVVDNSRRMYAFCCDHWPGGGFEGMLTIDEYWSLKRMRVDEAGWLEANFGATVDRAAWAAEKLGHMEDERYLMMDHLIPGALDALVRLRSRFDMVLVSRRERHDALVGELKRLGVLPLLDDMILLTHSDCSKAAAITARYDVGPDDALAGDTEDDLQAGTDLGVRTFLLLTGIRSGWVSSSFATTGVVQVEESIISLAKALVPDALSGGSSR